MTIASFLAIIAALLVRFGFYGELFGGGGRRAAAAAATTTAVAAIIMLAMMVVGIVVYAISFLLIRLLSRYRELAADRAGALLTGQPSALASALTKVSGSMARIPDPGPAGRAAAQCLLLRPRAEEGQVPAWPRCSPPIPRWSGGSATVRDLRAARRGKPWDSSTPCSAGPSRSSRSWMPSSRCLPPPSPCRPRWGWCRPARARCASGRRRAGRSATSSPMSGNCWPWAPMPRRWRSPSTTTDSPGWSAGTPPMMLRGWSPTCTR